MLAEIGAGQIPQLRIYNKIDRLDMAPRVERDASGRAIMVWISAARALGLDALREAIAERLDLNVRRQWLQLPPGRDAGAMRARLHAADVVRDERTLASGVMELLVELPATELALWAARPGVRLLPLVRPAATARAGRGRAAPRRVATRRAAPARH